MGKNLEKRKKKRANTREKVYGAGVEKIEREIVGYIDIVVEEVEAFGKEG